MTRILGFAKVSAPSVGLKNNEGTLELTHLPPPPGHAVARDRPSNTFHLEQPDPPVLNPHHRIHQLERNIAFLQTQHDEMLRDLHNEIRDLQRKNSELQFQLVMSGIGFEDPGVATIIRHENIDLESLENDIKALQADLHQARTRNVYLSNLVEEQKRTLEEYERQTPVFSPEVPSSPVELSQSSTVVTTPVPHNERTLSVGADRGPSPPVPDEYLRKLQEAEDMILQLRQENEQQRKELSNIRNSAKKSANLKFRGCNHPNQRRTPVLRQAQNQVQVTPIKISDDQRRKKLLLRSESMDMFPPLQSEMFPSKANKIHIHPELPPVPGSSGSDSSSVTSKRRLNLITLDSSGLDQSLPSLPPSKTSPKKGKKAVISRRFGTSLERRK